MDTTDKKILKLLSENANITATEIGEAVSLSIPAVNKRILRMQRDGIIDFFTIVTNSEKIGKVITAFVFVVIRYGDNTRLLLEYANSDPDVLECYSVTGKYDYMLKICAEDIVALENKILNIKKINGVTESHTMISLAEHKFQPTVLPNMI